MSLSLSSNLALLSSLSPCSLYPFITLYSYYHLLSYLYSLSSSLVSLSFLAFFDFTLSPIPSFHFLHLLFLSSTTLFYPCHHSTFFFLITISVLSFSFPNIFLPLLLLLLLTSYYDILSFCLSTFALLYHYLPPLPLTSPEITPG